MRLRRIDGESVRVRKRGKGERVAGRESVQLCPSLPEYNERGMMREREEQNVLKTAVFQYV